MSNIQSILATTDFSPAARLAVERAAMLGKILEIQKGVLLHVLEKSWLDSVRLLQEEPEEVDKEIVDVSRSLDGLAGEIHRSSGFSFEPQVRAGNALDIIAETASSFDLLVLGARGRHPIRALALGTTSQRVLSKVHQPVLVVKHRAEKSYQRILVGIDFSPNSLKGLQYGQIIAPQALIHLVHVFEPLFERKMISGGVSDEVIERHRVSARMEAEAQMTHFIGDAGVNSRKLVSVVEHGYARGKLPEIARKLVPDLFIVGKHGRTRVEEFLLGSVTVHVLAESRSDVLVA